MAGTKPVVLCDNETLESYAGTHSGPEVQGDWNRANGAKKNKTGEEWWIQQNQNDH